MIQRRMGSNIHKICVRNRFKNRDSNCVKGGQGSPQGLALEEGLTWTPGSSMNRPAQGLAAGRPEVLLYAVSRARKRVVNLVFASLAIVAMFAQSGVPARAESANSMYKHGQAAEAREDYDAAFDLYQRAMAKAPADVTYKAAFARVRVSASAAHMAKGRKLLEGGDEQGALVEFLHASEVDSSNDAAGQEIARIRKSQGQATSQGETSLEEHGGPDRDLASMGSPVILKPLSNEPIPGLHYAGDAKEVYLAIGKAAGLNVLFDPDYTSKRITVDLTNESLLDALRIVGTMSNTFWHAVTENTIFVAQNTVQKRRDLEETAIQTFYLTNAWQTNDLTDVATAIRNLMTGGSLKIMQVPSQNAIVVRGTPDELMVAQKLINDLDKARPEVVVDIAIMQVSKNWERTLGIQWPSSVGIALQSPTSSTSTTTTTTTGTTSDTGTTPSLYDLSHLKATDFAVTVGGATANLLLTDSNSKILQSPRIRATDSQKATMKIGERIPYATGSYGGGGLSGVGGAAGLGIGVQTQFQYQDIGVNIEMTPTVHYDHEVTLKIKIDITALNGNSNISGVTEPIIGQNVVDQVIRLREGEASILGGINEKQDTVSWSGIPGLSSIPILRYLFGSKDHTIADTELVFLVVPHIVRSQMLDRDNLRTIDTGAGTTIELRHISTAVQDGAKPGTGTEPGPGNGPGAPVQQGPGGPGQRPAPGVPPPPRSSIGVVPGQSAIAAAPAAMAQLDASAEANGITASKAAVSPPGAPGGMPVSPAPPGGPPVGTASVAVMFSPPSNPVAAGSTFQVPVILNGGKDLASVPLQVQYDPAKLSLVNVTSGDLLGRDNQAVALVHRDDGPGTITIDAARPPGVAGVTGSGVVCVLSFQAKSAGDTSLQMVKVSAINSAQQQIPAQGSRATISVH